MKLLTSRVWMDVCVSGFTGVAASDSSRKIRL